MIAIRKPTRIKRRVPKKLSDTYRAERQRFPLCKSSTNSSPNVEKVVNPPQTPTIQNARKNIGSDKPEEYFNRAPMSRAPVKLTRTVFQMVAVGTKTERSARATEPQAPPNPTNIKY